ncbi:putative dipeptidyl-aminopeptidase B [Clavispora lusitaniae]|uniref:Dipeptidyl-aminopeptidase B n=1 Tax=Clavispora lusitaniae TaxID=36911 RepID=A0ACD0WIC2_CLALS|nr:putative dipeptidyl-aminopeptidase B [Clavispora lusitaniae]QFZ33433.1 putative dipeptidyl-aminopeptidase B [Clavispora lusitaniae]QFZ39104.1 putative dipeptidyl-aminopeptidase B [Clavispora lusitaniae]QFZ44786.1 putative dipeptidyl-aminopeptidase B [Clavispora lusitaniae]QFZ50463.1 putative dipeptidyl-aminopeptidase B [Clavispora lusitaniae]
MTYLEKDLDRETRKDRVYRTWSHWARLAILLVWGTGFLIFATSYTFSLNASPSRISVDQIFPTHGHLGKGKELTFDALRKGEFRPNVKSVQWIHSPESVSNDQGTYLLTEKKGDCATKYVVKSLSNESYHYSLYGDSSFSYEGTTYKIDELFASPDLNRALLRTNTTKGWRHSSTALFWVLDVESQAIEPLSGKDLVSTALWAPTSDKIAFVLDNDVYIRHLHAAEVERITKDGSVNIFNGKPDWVYEEEVFAADIAMWWSPQGDKVAFLRFNDTNVPEYTIPYYVQKGHEDYPEIVTIKYPKPGYPNPEVQLVVATLDPLDVRYIALESAQITDRLVTEVLWVADDSLLVKTTNRASDLMEVFLIEQGKAKVVRTHYAKDSWFEVGSNAVYVPKNESLGRSQDGYVDVVMKDGFSHLAYFAPPHNAQGVFLTEGQWDVLSSTVDARNNVIYFSATLESSVQRHFYSVSLTEPAEPRKLTNGTAWYTGTFSSGARYLLLNYGGPDVPTQRLVDLHTMATVKVIETNTELRQTMTKYDIPPQNVSSVVLEDGVEANYLEIRPPNFDCTKKYPVLFYVYGGPGSQLVTNDFSVGFSHVVAAQLNAIVVTVDGRGTGFNTRTEGGRFKFCVRDQLGHYEPLDQIRAAQIWAEKQYVDSTRMAIWGWSYGGFLTLKTLETDTEHVFSYGVAVAPVTKWRLYDSVYTERYMRTPQENPTGYATASIQNATNFAGVTRFLVMHGSGDDNVHFQNSMSLVDDLNLAAVENFDFMVFPDSDHSIRFHNGNAVVFDRILGWLRHAFNNDYA